MLRLPPFALRRPQSLDEAARILAGEGSKARLVAGGTDLWPNMKRRHQTAATVVSLMRVPGLHEIRGGTSGDGTLRLGATALLAQVEGHPEVRRRFPALAKAVASISSPPLRNMGTIGGNICLDTRCTYYNQTEPWRRAIDYCMKASGSICWVAPSSPRCWAHSASDAAPVLATLGGRVRLVAVDGEREVPVDELYRDDGIDYLGKRPDEIVAEIILPVDADARNCRSAFWKLRRRGAIDFAVLSVAAAVWSDPRGVVERVSLCLGAVGSRPVTVDGAVDALVGRRLDDESIARAARLARKAATPMDNTDFQTQWRGKMAEAYTLAALREVAGLDPQLHAPRHRLAVLD